MFKLRKMRFHIYVLTSEIYKTYFLSVPSEIKKSETGSFNFYHYWRACRMPSSLNATISDPNYAHGFYLNQKANIEN